ncbi:DUF3558 domain-containing protein [Actinophytocola sp. KF-1]
MARNMGLDSMRIRHSLVLTSLLGLVVAAGCTTTSEGEPRPADTGAATSGPTSGASGDDDELPFAGAPEVDDPLDTSRYEQDPCASITAEQAQQDLNLPPAGRPMDNVALGVGCEWKNNDTRAYLHIVFVVDDPRGLSPEYEVNEKGGWDFFEELPEIEGYPAIARDRPDDRSRGYCTVVVGVADDMSFESTLQLRGSNIGKKDPCEMAAFAAGLALRTMKEGA